MLRRLPLRPLLRVCGGHGVGCHGCLLGVLTRAYVDKSSVLCPYPCCSCLPPGATAQESAQECCSRLWVEINMTCLSPPSPPSPSPPPPNPPPPPSPPPRQVAVHHASLCAGHSLDSAERTLPPLPQLISAEPLPNIAPLQPAAAAFTAAAACTAAPCAPSVRHMHRQHRDFQSWSGRLWVLFHIVSKLVGSAALSFCLDPAAVT